MVNEYYIVCWCYCVYNCWASLIVGEKNHSNKIPPFLKKKKKKKKIEKKWRDSGRLVSYFKKKKR